MFETEKRDIVAVDWKKTQMNAQQYTFNISVTCTVGSLPNPIWATEFFI